MQKLFLVCLFIVFVSLPIYAQDIEYVMTKYFHAIGGKNRIDTIRNYTVEYSGTIDGENISGRYINIRPYLFRYEIINEKTKAITCVGYDGVEGWMYDSRVSKSNFKPYEKFPGVRNRGLHSQNFMNYFIYAHENGYVTQMLGLRKIDSTMCYCIKLLNFDRDMEVKCFINALTFKLVKEIHTDLSVAENDPKKIYEEINYLEYKSIGGIIMPYRVQRISTILNTRMVTEQIFTNYTFNQKMEMDFLKCVY